MNKEFELCKKHWPSCSRHFLTLTYNNDYVPFYVNEDGERKYCPDFSDVQKMLKLLRKHIKCGLRYFACVEFGEKRGRIHYHLMLITENYFHENYLYSLIYNKCWIRYVNKVPDPSHPAHQIQTKKGLQFVPAGSLGFIKNIYIKEDGSRRKDYNCYKYVCKYITKSDHASVFSKSQSLRVRSSLGFGLGPCHEVPFTREDLVRGYVFLPYSQTNRFYIPDLYYNSMTFSLEDLKKNARYVDYVQHIENLINDRFFCYENSITSNEIVQYELAEYLHSKRFPSPEYQSIKLDRLIFSFKRILSQIPNLYLTEFFKDFDDKFDYKTRCRDIASQYSEDDLLDCMLYVLPYLDRNKEGFYSSTGVYVSDPSIYADVVFLFNCLTCYIKYNQAINHSLSLQAQADDEDKSNYFNSLYYEQTYLSKASESSRRELWTPELRCSSSYRRRLDYLQDKKHLSVSYCPF